MTEIAGIWDSALDTYFPRYTEFNPAVPVWCVTPGEGRVIHRFYDTSPFSPSGRYLALTRLPYEDRLPLAGDVAEVVLVDLQTGSEGVVAETRGWDTQLGAQVQWGTDDYHLFFNDVDVRSWRPHGVKLNPLSGERQDLQGTVYNVSSNGKWAVSPCLLRTSKTQAGYGVHVPRGQFPVNRGASENDGIYITDLQSGESKLLLSIAELLRRNQSAYRLPDATAGDYYGFHVKWNAAGNRLIFILRWAPKQGGLFGRWQNVPKSQMKKNVLTIEMNGDEPGDVHVAIADEVWSRGGHHPNWCPDGEHIIMNLNLTGEGLRFATARYDGSRLRALNDNIVGSGHPTMDPGGRFVLADAYLGEPMAFGDGTVPIRLVDLQNGTEETLVRIPTRPDFRGPKKELRVDAHPAWDGSRNNLIAFNAFVGGTRRVFVADLSAKVGTNSHSVQA